jgi:hypothetical protein
MDACSRLPTVDSQMDRGTGERHEARNVRRGGRSVYPILWREAKRFRPILWCEAWGVGSRDARREGKRIHPVLWREARGVGACNTGPSVSVPSLGTRHGGARHEARGQVRPSHPERIDILMVSLSYFITM